MKREKAEKLFKLIIAEQGRPSTAKLVELLGEIEGHEASRRFYLGDFAVFTDAQLVNMAEKSLKRLGN